LGRSKFNIKSLLAKWAVNAIALLIVVKTIKGLNITAEGTDGLIVLFVAAAVIGIINAFLKPVVLLLTLPINILSFGLFTLIINAIMFGLAGYLVKGFEVTSFWGAIIGSIVFSIVSMIAGIFIRAGDEEGIDVKYKVIE